MIDANILLQGQVPDVGSAMLSGFQARDAINNLKNAPLKRQAMQQEVDAQKMQIDKAKAAIPSERDQMRFRSVAFAAHQLKPYIDANDPQGAMRVLQSRIQAGKTLGYPDDYMSDTAEAVGRLQQGGVAALKPEVDSAITAAGQLGIFRDPSAARNQIIQTASGWASANPDTGIARPFQMAGGGGQTAMPVAADLSLQEKLAGVKEGAQTTGYSDRRDIEGRTAPIIAGGAKQAELNVESKMRPTIAGNVEAATQTAKQEAERKGGVIKAISGEKEVGRILDLATPLLSKATESLAGVGIDKLGKLVGVSNEGSRVAAKLKTLEGALIMQMPRMEGPQSNADTLLYRQMAAQIGDATTPAEERQAAISILRQLNARYTGSQSPSQPSAAQIQGGQPGNAYKSSGGVQFTVE